jgi:hypothetical protein
MRTKLTESTSDLSSGIVFSSVTMFIRGVKGVLKLEFCPERLICIVNNQDEVP